MKKNTRFALARKGYDIEAVESYIALESAKVDEAQLEMRTRIKDLQAQCDSLNAQLAEMKDREEQIKSAFITATDNANKLTQDVLARYSAELQRLKLFKAKWFNAYEQMKQRYHFDKDALNMESVALSVELELKKFLATDFSLNDGKGECEMEEYFRSEVDRLTRQQIDAQKGRKIDETRDVEALKNKLKEYEMRLSDGKKEDGAAFSLEEAKHPKESLEDICKSLGIKGTF